MRRLSQLVAMAGLVVLAAGCAVVPLTEPITPQAVPAAASAQEVEAGRALFPIQRGGRFGFADTTGALVIEPRFESAGPFREGRARAQLGGQWGYLAPDGEWAIGPNLLDAADFSEGRARVVLISAPSDLSSRQAREADRRFRTFIAPDGTPLLDADLAAARDFVTTSAGPLAVVARTRARRYVPLGFLDFLAPTFQGRPIWLGLNADGEVVFEADFAQTVLGFSEDRAAFEERRGVFQRSGRWGYLDPAGVVVIEPRYERALAFSEGLAAAAEGGRFGFIDPAGTFVIEPRFETAGPFREGVARVMENGRWGYIRPNGSWLAEPIYDAAFDASEGLLAVGREGRFGFLSTSGVTAIPLRYDSTRPFERGLALVRLDGRSFYIDRAGRTVIE